MTSRILKVLAILAVSSLVAGCKLALMVPSGGDVTSLSGTRNCAGGNLCEHNITDSTFNDSFTAVARPGYVFSKWSAGSDFLCANSTNPTCVITNVGTAGNAGIEAVIATGKFFYAMPLFTFVGIDTDGDGIKDHLDADDDNDGLLDVDDNCPLAAPNFDGFGCPYNGEAVIANGRQWYQPDLFTNLSWNQINAVCPAGVCRAGGRLNGRDMTGWTWASMGDVAALFNSYMPYPMLSITEPDRVEGIETSWAPKIFAAGFRDLGNFSPWFRDLSGITSTLSYSYSVPYARYAQWLDGMTPDRADAAYTHYEEPLDKSFNSAWFYR